jgi:hypothetical protein
VRFPIQRGRARGHGGMAHPLRQRGRSSLYAASSRGHNATVDRYRRWRLANPGRWLVVALGADLATYLTNARASVLPWLLVDLWLAYRILARRTAGSHLVPCASDTRGLFVRCLLDSVAHDGWDPDGAGTTGPLFVCLVRLVPDGPIAAAPRLRHVRSSDPKAPSRRNPSRILSAPRERATVPARNR